MASRKYQAYLDFSAQSHTVSALMSMYSLVGGGEWKNRPLTPIVVFIAFAIESYLNSIGSRKVPFWDDVERLPWKKKINILHGVIGREADWSKDPLQFAAEVFRMRDKLAHGRSERVTGRMETEKNQAFMELQKDALTPDWLANLNGKWVEDSQHRFRELMQYLSAMHDLHESDHLHLSTGGVLTHDA